MWARIEWLQEEQFRLAGGPVSKDHDPANPPALTFTAREFPCGYPVPVMRLYKVPCNERYTGDMLTEDEVAVWRYLEHLQAQNAATAAKLEAMPAPVASVAAPVPVEASTGERVDISNAVADDGAMLSAPLSNTLQPLAALQLDSAGGAALLSPYKPGATGDVEPEGTPDPLESTGAADARQRAEELLLADPAMPNGAVGEACGRSGEFVRKIRLQLQQAGRLQPTAVRRADGSMYTPPGAKEATAEVIAEVPNATATGI